MPDLYNVYFVAQFDRPFTSYGTWKNADVSPESAQSAGAGSGGWVTFDTTRNRVVRVKVGLSFVSEAGALANLRAESKGWNLEEVRNAATAAWQNMLGRVAVSGGTQDERRIFYTALYHALLHPNIESDVTGLYPGFDGKIHHVRPGHVEYGNFSGWDIYRTQAPLEGFLAPQEASDAAQSLVDAARQGGWYPKWALVNGYTAVMAGDAADPIIAGYYAFGARNFDTHGALAAMVKGATVPVEGDPPGQGWYVERLAGDEYLSRGYVVNDHTTNVAPVPNGASETLEYALADFSIAQFAHALGDDAVYRAALKRSQNWANLFDTSSGLIAPRDADGAFMQTPITADGQSGFQEGNAAQYTWMTQQDYADLIRGMGGRAATIKKLDVYFSQLNAQQDHPYAWMGNEPSIGDPFAYLAAGEPWRAQQVIRAVQTTQWLNEPQGLAGNDDLGTMSAWYVWNAMGLYPENPAVRGFAIGTPLFSHIEVRVPNGPAIDIDAPQASDAAPYIQSLYVNGKPTQKTWLPLPMGGTLHLTFAMASTPNTSWGAAPEDAPPSYSLTPVTFPPSTLAALDASNPGVALPAGGSAPLQFAISNAQSTDPVTVNWKAEPPPGIHVQPATGEVTLGEAASTPVSLAITADAGTPAGYYDIPIRAQTADGALLQHLTVVAQVGALSAMPLAYALNSHDHTVMPIDLRTHAVGPAITVAKGVRDEALTADHSRLFVLTRNQLETIDTATQKIVGSVSAGKEAHAIAISPDGNTVWVAQRAENAVLPFDARSLKPGKAIPIQKPSRFAMTPDGSTLYVMSNDLGTVTPVNVHTGAVGTPIDVGADLNAIAIAPDGKALYVLRGIANDVAAIDVATNAVLTKTIPAGVDPSSIAITPDGSRAFVTNWAARTVTPIDLRTGTAGTAITVGGGPWHVVFTADGKTALVVINEDDAVVPIDVQTGRAGAPIHVGRSPIAVVTSQ
jgi:predicted alpha-1,2-mannosidase